MHATPYNVAISTVAVGLVKEVFEPAFADADARIVERRRLDRTTQLDRRGPT